MSDWLQSQPNCSSPVVTVVLDAVLHVTQPFTSNYDCTITTARTSCLFILTKIPWLILPETN